MEAQYRQYIGKLADSSEGDNRYNIFINKSDAIQYRVSPLILPEEQGDVFGFMNSFADEIELAEDENTLEDHREDEFYNHVYNKLFIYCKKKDDNGYVNMVAGKTNLVNKPPKFEEDTKFYVIPTFCSKNNQDVVLWQEEKNWKLFREYRDKEEFIEFLRRKESVGSLYGYDEYAFTPSFVIWIEEDGRAYAIGNIIAHKHSDLQSKNVFECNKIACVDITEYGDHWVYTASLNPTILYMPEKVYKKIEESLLDEKNVVEEQVSEFTEDTTLGNFVLSEKLKEQFQINGDAETDFNAEAKTTVDIAARANAKTDEQILLAMDYYSQKRDLFYNRKDFANLHTALKCNSLVILSGLSGTGKSAIVDIYASALGANRTDDSEESRLLFIPVRPSWNDDSDLIGYVDLVNMEYHAADSGFVDFLVRAQKEENKDKLFLVCFDEMNLARTEYYFSQFLSLMERPEDQRELKLYDKKYSEKLKNASEYPYKIKIGNNIRFIGTVNVDETTHHFSDKVLDRANIIQLDVINYAKDWEKKSCSALPEVDWSLEDYHKITAETYSKDSKRVRELLWDIHTLLRSSSLKYGIGPRIVKDIICYLNNLPAENVSGISYGEGVDLQIVQRVLTKVRGPENQLGKVLESTGDNNLYQIFDAYKDLSDFSLCREIVTQKQRELEAYGYCI